MKALAEKGVELKEHPALQVREYIYDMAPVMRAADLVICRAGSVHRQRTDGAGRSGHYGAVPLCDQ